MTYKNVVQAGQVRLLAKFLPRYVKRSYESSYTITTGRISEQTIPDWTVIASYAGGHHSMVRNLALDLKSIRVSRRTSFAFGGWGGQVDGISSGLVDTPLWRQPAEKKAQLMQKYAKKLTTGRPGRAEDVAESFMAVIRDWNATGHMVRTDGGASVMAE